MSDTETQPPSPPPDLPVLQPRRSDGDIAAILLVPYPDWVLALLAAGPCGSLSPAAFRYGPSFPWSAGRHDLAAEHALVLAWDGDPLPEGVHRLMMALRGQLRPHQTVPQMAKLAEKRGLGRVAMLDDTGREVIRG